MESSSISQGALIQENVEESEKEEDRENGEESSNEEDFDEEEPQQNTLPYKKKFGFKENEIVWATIEERFWPALVHKIGDDGFIIYFIDRPNRNRTDFTNVHMLVPVEDLSEQLHTFGDENFNKKMLIFAGQLPDNDMFIKAVEKADTFARKRIYGKDIDGFSFFDISKYVEYADEEMEFDSDESSIIEENVTESKETVDLRELANYIFDRKCDKHVVGIYKGKIKSERHDLYGLNDDSKLKHMYWFGLFKIQPGWENLLRDYLMHLFKFHFPPRVDLHSYVLEVWLPEALIKAISIAKHVCLLEAELIFYKQGINNLDIDDFDEKGEDSRIVFSQ